MADIFTQVGEELVVDILDGTALPTWRVGWGTGAGTAAKGDTVLFTEASEARVVATISQPSADIIRFLATIVADGTKTITNAGVLSLATGGILLIHFDHSGIPLLISESIQYTIDLEFT